MVDDLEKSKAVSRLCEYIWGLEHKYDLLAYDIKGVRVWQLARMQVYYSLAKGLGILSQPHEKNNKFKYILGLLKGMFYGVVDSPLKLVERDVVILSHPRVVKSGENYIDIYTDEIKKELKSSFSVVDFELPYIGTHKKNKDSDTHYLDWLDVLFEIWKRVKINKSSNIELDRICKIERDIKRDFDIDVDLCSLVARSLDEYLFKYKFYNYLFKKINPGKLFIVVAYYYPFIVRAAKDNGVEVIELQHGTIGKYHLGYSYPEGYESDLKYFPDKIYLWGDCWKKRNVFPLRDSSVLIDKFRYLESEKRRIHEKGVLRDKGNLVVISQGAIGEKIADKILNNIQDFKEFTIYYKLHPGEFERSKSYKSLNLLEEKYGAVIVKNEIPLYELFMMSSYQIGVFSTAIYEGIEFGCKTILLDLPGIEYMNDLISNKDIKVI